MFELLKELCAGRHLEQQLIFGDTLYGFDQVIADGHPRVDLLLDFLFKSVKTAVIWNSEGGIENTSIF